MAWTNTKTAIGIGIGLLVAAATTAVAFKGVEAIQPPEWQKHYDASVLDRLPSQVKILPSLPATVRSGTHLWANYARLIGWGESVMDLFKIAYGVSPNQLIWHAPIAGPRYRWGAEYDFISNLPKPAESIKAMQKAIQKKFGLAARSEMIETNVLILTVQSSHAPGLHPNTHHLTSFNAGPDSLSSHGQTPLAMANYLGQYLGVIVIDRTDLSNNCDIDFKWDGTHDGLKRALLEQAGLELTQTNMAVQMLVVEPAK